MTLAINKKVSGNVHIFARISHEDAYWFITVCTKCNFSPTSPKVVSNSDELDPIEESRPGTRVPSNALQKRNKTRLHQVKSQ